MAAVGSGGFTRALRKLDILYCSATPFLRMSQKGTAHYTAEVDITGKGLAQFAVTHIRGLHFRIYAHSPPNHLSPTAPEHTAQLNGRAGDVFNRPIWL